MALATETTDLKKGVTLTGPNYIVCHLVTTARLLKRKLILVIADIDESATAAVAADGADDPAKKKRAAAAPPTITDEQEAEVYDLLISTISESVLTRLLNVNRIGRAFGSASENSTRVSTRLQLQSARKISTHSNISEER